MSVVSVVLFIAGGIMVYSGIFDKNPQQVVTDAFTASKAAPKGTKTATPPATRPTPIEKPGGGGGSAAV